jgi:hypothetical protein
MALVSGYNGSPCVGWGSNYQAHLAGLATGSVAHAVPTPIISNGVPAYASSGTASAANDGNYNTEWSASSTSGWLAYDLSSVAAYERTKVTVAWYTNSYGYTVDPPPGCAGWQGGEPANYTIDVNAAPGGTLPSGGWVTMATVTGNGFHSKQHQIRMSGYNWVRINVASTGDGSGSPANINLNMDVASGQGDSWLMLGDSITAGGMEHNGDPSFTDQVSAATTGRYTPIQEDGGLPCALANDMPTYVDAYLAGTS